jgi:hypothetical protein
VRGSNPAAVRISVQAKLRPSAAGLPEPEENLDVGVEVALLAGVDRADEFPIWPGVWPSYSICGEVVDTLGGEAIATLPSGW